MVEPENIESLTNKIDWVLSNQDISKEVALNGKNLILKIILGMVYPKNWKNF